jgi:hypothetical protein
MKTRIFTLLFLITTSYCFSQIKYVLPETVEADSWNGTGWDNFTRSTYTFNDDCLPTTILSEFNFLGTWTDQVYTTLTYAGNPLTITVIAQNWNIATMTWDNIGKTEHFYNANEEVIETKNYDWNGGVWQLRDRFLYTYVSLFLFDTVTTQTWDNVNSIWVNSERTTYSYSGTNKVISTITHLWNTASSLYDINHSRVINIYDGNDLLTSEEYDDWDGAQWVHDFLNTYTYDGSNFVIIKQKSDWNGASYDLDSQELHTNNGDGYPTETISQNWNGASFENTTRLRQTYPSCLSLSVEENNLEMVEIYPNPSNSKINITNIDNANYTIVNLTGQSVAKGKIDSINNTINLTTLKSGLYILSLKTNGKRLIKKIIKN